MASWAVAGHDVTISEGENKAYWSLFHDTHTVEDLEAEILLSPRYPERDEDTRLVWDQNIVNLSYAGSIDIEGNCFLADETIEGSQRLVEIPAMPNLDSICDQWSIQPSENMLGICVPSSPEDYTPGILPNFDHRMDARDCFQQPVPCFSDSSTEIVHTDGRALDPVTSLHHWNCSLRSFTAPGMDQADDMNSCPSLEFEMSPVWPEISHCNVPDNVHSIDFVLDETLGIPLAGDLLANGDISNSRHLDSNVMALSNSITTTNSQRYDIVSSGHVPYEFTGVDQYSPVEDRLGCNDAYHVFGGSCPTSAMAAVSCVGSNSFVGPLLNAVEQHYTNNNYFVLEPTLVKSQYIPFKTGETINDNQTSGNSHSSSLQASSVGSFTAEASSMVDNRLWATSDHKTSTTFALNTEKTLRRIDHGVDYSTHGRSPETIVQKGIDMTATTLQNKSEKSCMGLSKQHRKSTTFRSAWQPALKPKTGSNATLTTRRNIFKASETYSMTLPQSQKRETTHLLREHACKASEYNRSTQPKSSKGLVRRKFQEHERIKVAKVREAGSCMICRQQKAPCSEDGPCGRCVKTAGSATLASHICVRDGLFTFRLGSPDLYDQCHKILFNKLTHKASFQLPWPLKLSRWLERWFETKQDVGPRAQKLDRECTSAFQGINFSPNGILASALAVNDEVAQPLLIRIWADWEPFSDDLEIRIDHFIRRYCRFGPITAMRRLACATLAIKVFSSYLLLRAKVRTLHGVLGIESQVLSTVDELIRHGCSGHDVIVLGLCLRTLGLRYRGIVKYCRLSSCASADNCKRHKNILAMYHAMVTGYSNVCRGAASPFSAGWRVEDHAKAFGNDAGLMGDFTAIMELEKQWREEQMDEDDVVFRKLVLERKERVRKPQRK